MSLTHVTHTCFSHTSHAASLWNSQAAAGMGGVPNASFRPPHPPRSRERRSAQKTPRHGSQRLAPSRHSQAALRFLGRAEAAPGYSSRTGRGGIRGGGATLGGACGGAVADGPRPCTPAQRAPTDPLRSRCSGDRTAALGWGRSPRTERRARRCNGGRRLSRTLCRAAQVANKGTWNAPFAHRLRQSIKAIQAADLLLFSYKLYEN